MGLNKLEFERLHKCLINRLTESEKEYIISREPLAIKTVRLFVHTKYRLEMLINLLYEHHKL